MSTFPTQPYIILGRKSGRGPRACSCLLTSAWRVAVVFHRTNAFDDGLDDLFRRAQISKNRRITYQCGKEACRKVVRKIQTGLKKNVVGLIIARHLRSTWSNLQPFTWRRTTQLKREDSYQRAENGKDMKKPRNEGSGKRNFYVITYII